MSSGQDTGASANAETGSMASPEAPTGLRPSGYDPARGRRAEALLRVIVATTHSHIDGRDLLAELHPRKTLDIKRRVDGVETWFEGDWLSNLKDQIDRAKAFLFSAAVADQHQRSASAMSAGTAETPQEAQGHRPASAVAKPDAHKGPSQ
jgi:hypothetical protein